MNNLKNGSFFKSLIAVFLLAGALGLGFSQHRKNATLWIEKSRYPSEKATLVCRLDEKGQLWSLIHEASSPWERIWPDQIQTLVHDEKNLHKDKALVHLYIDPACRFGDLWHFLEICQKEAVLTSLQKEAFHHD
jgi:hypothetical protein